MYPKFIKVKSGDILLSQFETRDYTNLEKATYFASIDITIPW